MFVAFTNFLPAATFTIAFVIQITRIAFVEVRGCFTLQHHIIQDVIRDVIVRTINYTNQMELIITFWTELNTFSPGLGG